MRIVADTNTVVSGLLWSGPPQQLINAARAKHWAGFPSESIRYCLSEAGIRLGDVDVVAINQDAGANLWKKVAYPSSIRRGIHFVRRSKLLQH